MQRPRSPSKPAQRNRGFEPPKLPQPDQINYFVADNRPDPKLMDQIAEDTAKRLRSVSTTQLRRFYDDVLTLRQRLDAERVNKGTDAESAFDELRADFNRMLKAKAVYAHGRSQKTVTVAAQRGLYPSARRPERGAFAGASQAVRSSGYRSGSAGAPGA